MADWSLFRRTSVDRAVASARENASLAAAARRDAVDAGFRAAMGALALCAAGIVIGASAHDGALPVLLDLAELLGAGHGLVLGRTATGKTRMVLGIIAALLRRFLGGGPDEPCVYMLDYKGDLHALVRDFVAELAAALPSAQANKLLDALVIIDPFSSEALVPLNVLARDAASQVPPEVQAFEVASMFERMTRAPTGVVQDQWLFHLLLLGVCDGRLGLPDLVPLVTDQAARNAAAARSPNAEVRRFFSEGRPMPAASAAGLQVRAKLLAYVRERAAGTPLFSAPDLLVLVSTEGKRRLANIRDIIVRIDGAPAFRAILLADLRRGVLLPEILGLVASGFRPLAGASAI